MFCLQAHPFMLRKKEMKQFFFLILKLNLLAGFIPASILHRIRELVPVFQKLYGSSS